MTEPLPLKDKLDHDSDALQRALAALTAVLLDLDGTLVSSRYDWKSIREELRISGPSIIDALNGLGEYERERRWKRMREIEREATRTAKLRDGAHELLDLLSARGLGIALVTNNSAENAEILLTRFDLQFDLVLTRDDGSWKPSGAPLLKAMRFLGAHPRQSVLIGDSRFDLMAAREAGLPLLAVGSRTDTNLEDADRIFPTSRVYVPSWRNALVALRVNRRPDQVGSIAAIL